LKDARQRFFLGCKGWISRSKWQKGRWQERRRVCRLTSFAAPPKTRGPFVKKVRAWRNLKLLRKTLGHLFDYPEEIEFTWTGDVAACFWRNV